MRNLYLYSEYVKHIVDQFNHSRFSTNPHSAIGAPVQDQVTIQVDLLIAQQIEEELE